MTRTIEFDEVPKGKDNVVQYLTRYCKSRDIEISFDDANGNFGNIRNQSACGYGIECSVFNEGDDDLLLFSVFHELGHMRGVGSTTKFKCVFAAEYEAWHWAIDNYMMTFGENITDRQAKYMLGCLSSYANNANSFWCPMKGYEE